MGDYMDIHRLLEEKVNIRFEIMLHSNVLGSNEFEAQSQRESTCNVWTFVKGLRGVPLQRKEKIYGGNLCAQFGVDGF